MPTFESATYSHPYTLRPISDRTGFRGRPMGGDRNPFRRSTYTDTLEVLTRELHMRNARSVVLELDVRERDIRKDGGINARASLASTAVRLSFADHTDADVLPVVFATDRFGYDYRDQPKSQGWQDNLRAIALGLQDLRRVDRYGITQNRQQYRGFLAIEGGQGLKPSGMTTDVAAEIVVTEAGGTFSLSDVRMQISADVYLEARKRTHPDRRHGDDSAWHAVEEAGCVLKRAGML